MSAPKEIMELVERFDRSGSPDMKGRPRIEVDTPLIPWALARAALEDASMWLDVPLPQHWINALSDRMQTIYASNPEFRRRVRGRGSSGRDFLWAFTRHWLAALIYDYRRSLGERLPSSYFWGHPLPEKPSQFTSPGQILETRREKFMAAKRRKKRKTELTKSTPRALTRGRSRRPRRRERDHQL